MASWKNDIQNRVEIDKITEKMELPLYKPNAKGKLRDWLRESWEKIEDNFLELEKETNKKEPSFDKKTGFNLDKTDEYRLDDTNRLGTAKALKNLYDELNRKIEALNICPYKVGDIYVTTNNFNPANIWSGTSWEKIEGRFLKATERGENTKTIGGSNTKTLSVANLPAHSHKISIVANGTHTHTQASHAHTQPAHVHYMQEINRGLSSASSGGNGILPSIDSRYVRNLKTESAGGENTGSAQPAIYQNGNHSHSASIENTGNGNSFDIRPAYYTVNMWLRIS